MVHFYMLLQLMLKNISVKDVTVQNSGKLGHHKLTFSTEQ